MKKAVIIVIILGMVAFAGMEVKNSCECFIENYHAGIGRLSNAN